MVKWKTLLVEVVVLGAIALGVYGYEHHRDSLALWHKMGTPVTAPVTDPSPATFDNNAGRPTEAAPMPPKETASPTHRRPHHRPSGKRGSPDFWVGRPRAAQHSDFCKQIPAIAYNFDRATIIQAMRERGVSKAKQAQVLACLNK